MMAMEKERGREREEESEREREGGREGGREGERGMIKLWDSGLPILKSLCDFACPETASLDSPARSQKKSSGAEEAR